MQLMTNTIEKYIYNLSNMYLWKKIKDSSIPTTCCSGFIITQLRMEVSNNLL